MAEQQIAETNLRVTRVSKAISEFREQYGIVVGEKFCLHAAGPEQAESLLREFHRLQLAFDQAATEHRESLRTFCQARRAAGLAPPGLADDERARANVRTSN
jgi:hypothetical protein